MKSSSNGKHAVGTGPRIRRLGLDTQTPVLRCCKCKQHKHREAFYSDCGHPSGRYPRCRECVWEACTRSRLVRKFGITLEDYELLLAAQGGVCAICRQPEASIGKNGHLRLLAVDHDHRTGEVRGLLCSGCNQGIGHFRDSTALLATAIRYLEHHRQD